MKKFFNSNKTVYIILCLVILAGICRFSYGFFVEKQGEIYYTVTIQTPFAKDER